MPAVTPEDAGENASLARSRSEISQRPGYEEFFSEYQPKLKNYAANIIGQSYAEELAQETMIIVARRWDHVSFPARYSFTIMNRLCDRLRQRLELEGMHLLPHTLDEMRECAAGVIDERAHQEIHDMAEEGEFIREILSVLTLQQARCVYAKYMLDYNSKEIAGLLGIKPQTVRVHLANARKRITTSLGTFRE